MSSDGKRLDDISFELLPPIVRRVLETEGAILAGGAIRDMMLDVTPKDFDIFYSTEVAMKEVNNLLLRESRKSTSNGVTLTSEIDGLVIQSVFLKIYKDPWELMADFDFKNICGFMTNSEGHFREIREAEKAKKVVINCIRKPIKELSRLAKYKHQGYDCSEAYNYILSVAQDKGDGAILMSDFYDKEK